jgi:hypothetical protein
MQPKRSPFFLRAGVFYVFLGLSVYFFGDAQQTCKNEKTRYCSKPWEVGVKKTVEETPCKSKSNIGSCKWQLSHWDLISVNLVLAELLEKSQLNLPNFSGWETCPSISKCTKPGRIHEQCSLLVDAIRDYTTQYDGDYHNILWESPITM